MELLVESNGVIYDMTSCCTKLSLSESLNDGAGSLDFTYCMTALKLFRMALMSGCVIPAKQTAYFRTGV